jgi:hypothetical protein
LGLTPRYKSLPAKIKTYDSPFFHPFFTPPFAFLLLTSLPISLDFVAGIRTNIDSQANKKMKYCAPTIAYLINFVALNNLRRISMMNPLKSLSNFGSAMGGLILCAALTACGGGGSGPAATATSDDTQVAEGETVVTKAALATSLQVSGAIFTTDSGCGTTNGNLFPSKQDVYLDGGPRRIGSAGLPSGDYYVKVTTPSGALLLGQTPTASVTVDGPVNGTGNIIGCYQLWAILTPDGLPGPFSYLNTDNPGGEYKVWLSKDPTFPPNLSKTDNFKVGPTTTTPEFGKLSVLKFYDANANGIFDFGETEIVGWKINLLGLLSGSLGDQFTPYSALLSPDTYTVKEYMPIETNWYATKVKEVSVSIVNKSDITVEFGNVCTGFGNGRTLGFWSNKNGAALIDGSDLAALRASNLRNADGTIFDPNLYGELRTWLLSGTAVNMSYMLSVQMATMQLNVGNSLVVGSALIYAPGTDSANSAGFATVDALLKEANIELGLHGLVTAGSPFRDYQEALKNAFDKANNNLTFVQATPCAFTFAP